MDLADRKLILIVHRGGAVTGAHEWGGIRQHVLTRQTALIVDPMTVELPLPDDLDRLEAPPSFFAGVIAAATGLAATSTVVTVLATIASSIVGALVSLGLSLIERALFGQKGSDFGGIPNQVPVRQIVKQATPRQRFVYGRALVGGAFCYLAKKPPYLISQYLIAAHECDALEALYINGFRCDFNSAGDATTARFRRGGTPYIKISTRLGDPDQAIDPLLATEFPGTPTSFRQRGQTVVTVKAYYGDDYDDHERVYGPANTFTPLFLMRGRKVHDPRVYSSDVDDEMSWVWSDNWALCVADWMRAPFGGRKKVAQIDYDAIREEADICDQGVGTTTGAEKRYTLNGGFLSDQNPFQVIEAMLSAAGEAGCLWRRGQFAPQVDFPRETVRTLTQADLVAGFTFRSARGRGDVLNTVRSEFIYPDRAYVAAMTPPLVDPVALASDGQPLERTVQRAFVSGEERAQRLDKITLQRSRLGRELKLTIGIEHLDLEVGDHVNIEFDDFPSVNGTYVIRQAAAGGLLRTMELALQAEAPDSVHEWDPFTEVQDTSLTEIIGEGSL